MQVFKFHPNYVHKTQVQKLLLVSTEPDRNEVYEFEGISSTILIFFILEDQFTFGMAETIVKQQNADPKDLKVLWDFCIEEKLIIPAI